jgi:hypothetical protein
MTAGLIGRGIDEDWPTLIASRGLREEIRLGLVLTWVEITFFWRWSDGVA